MYLNIIIYVLFFICMSSGIGVEPYINITPPASAKKNTEKSTDTHDDIPVLKMVLSKINKSENIKNVSKVINGSDVINNIVKNHPDSEIESGAVMRGVLVFVCLTFLFLIYVGYKTCRKKSYKKNAMVKKYGVRTRRSDKEMEPLPLDDDDEDETVFELGSLNNR